MYTLVIQVLVCRDKGTNNTERVVKQCVITFEVIKEKIFNVESIMIVNQCMIYVGPISLGLLS